MKKLSLLLIITLTITACSLTEKDDQAPTISDQPELDLIFDHENFILTLPAPYQKDIKTDVAPKIPGTFPEIQIGVIKTSEEIAPEQILEWEEQGFQNLCDQTASCPEIIEDQEIEYDNIPGVYLVTESESIDGSIVKVYRYTFLKNDTFFRFISYEDEELFPEGSEEKMSKIIETISFK